MAFDRQRRRHLLGSPRYFPVDRGLVKEVENGRRAGWLPPGHVWVQGTPVVGVVETGHPPEHAEVMVEGAVLLHEEHDVLDRVEASSGGLDGSGLAHRFGARGARTCTSSWPARVRMRRQSPLPGPAAWCICDYSPSPDVRTKFTLFPRSSLCVLGVGSVGDGIETRIFDERTKSVFRFLAVNHRRRSCPGKVPVDHFSIWGQAGTDGRVGCRVSSHCAASAMPTSTQRVRTELGFTLQGVP